MRLLANENFPRIAVEALREAGHDIRWARLEMPGASDTKVLACAQREEQVLLTFDKDFGELAFRSGSPVSSGIMLFRIPCLSPEYLKKTILQAVAARDNWFGQFAVVEPDRIRVRSL
ncbi:MAG TPA: DUF5615 family PIN-like protein [Sumerlaeia bacterium]|nr:DUF5615 family PIN-like protein [Sumerlaeia bacterium]